MVENPDEIKEYFPSNCKHCGNDLSEVYAKFSGHCQILDIPPIHPIVTEHRIYTKQILAMRFNLLLHNAYKLYQEYSFMPKDLKC